MVVEKRSVDVVELRPGRFIFCRNWTLGNSIGNDDDIRSNKNERRITLICAHGTAANHSQFIPFLKSLESRLLLDDSHTMPVSIDCWMYDAVGCGESPVPQQVEDDPDVFCDSEQVQDLKALLQKHVLENATSSSSSSSSIDDHKTFIMGHSYGPNWIYKLILQLSKEETMNVNISGLILVSSSLGNPKYHLQKGGPSLFKLPLWILNCMQPFLTNIFLKIAFASATHTNNPQMIAEAKQANNQNDMKIVRRYYRAHDWAQDLSEIQKHYYERKITGAGTTSNTSTSCQPPLILHGIEDQVIPIQCGQDLANQWNAPIVSIPDASHMILLEQPDTMARHVLEYIITDN